MEPPLKRPRLSMFADEPDNAELDKARRQNDILLKNRFEAIFAKYSKDFAGIGDEIDLNTGELVVDNGHLVAMASEKDTGSATKRSISPREGKPVANGRSMLRAMTLAPDRDDSYFEDGGANDVIASIESIAGVITISSDEDESDNDGDEDTNGIQSDEEDVFIKPPPSPLPQLRQSSLNAACNADDHCASDGDSLFEVKEETRESSPDSLFEVETPPTSAGVEDNAEAQEVLARFGRNVGREVLDFLAKRDRVEMHIEPAWRIPVNLNNQQNPSIPRMDVSSEQPAEIRDSTRSSSAADWDSTAGTPDELDTSPNKGQSLWKGPARRSRSQMRRDRLWQRVREESEDPLQDGFNSAESSAFEEDPDEDADVERCCRIIKRGICPWCKEQFPSRTNTLQHLNRIIRLHKVGRKPTLFHNIDHILKVQPKIILRGRATGKGSRPARFLVCDFKTLVELHEGGGYSFEYIVAEKFLRTTRKDVAQLKQLYERYRTAEDDDDDAYIEPWTKQEKIIVEELGNNPLTNMDTIRIRLKTRGSKEIGSYLAEKWLMECRGEVDIKTEVAETGDENSEDFDDVAEQSPAEEDVDASRSAGYSSDDLFIGPSFPASGEKTFIKQEELGDGDGVDDLFVPNFSGELS